MLFANIRISSVLLSGMENRRRTRAVRASGYSSALMMASALGACPIRANKKRGPERRFGANGPFMSSLAGGGRLAALRRTSLRRSRKQVHGDFSVRAALFVRPVQRARASPSASSSHRLVVAGGGVPNRPGDEAASPASRRRTFPRITTPHECAPRGKGHAHHKAARAAGDKQSKKFFALK